MNLTGATPQTLRNAGSLEELYRSLATVDMGPGWNKKTPSLYPEPKKKFPAAIWHYTQAKAALDAAGRLINTELAERRNLILANAGAGSDYATSTTLVSAYQMIMPGEHARSHRHSPNALRLIVDAEPGTYTVVDGVRLEMMPGDVLLTPNWCWHGHGNDSKANGYWLDFLDVPLVHLLEPMFFEQNPDEYAPGKPPATGVADAFPVGRDEEAPRRGAARSERLLRHADRIRQSGACDDGASHDEDRRRQADQALSHDGEQSLFAGLGRGRDRRRRQKLPVGARRHAGRAVLAQPFPSREQGRRAVPRH